MIGSSEPAEPVTLQETEASSIQLSKGSWIDVPCYNSLKVVVHHLRTQYVIAVYLMLQIYQETEDMSDDCWDFFSQNSGTFASKKIRHPSLYWVLHCLDEFERSLKHPGHDEMFYLGCIAHHLFQIWEICDPYIIVPDFYHERLEKIFNNYQKNNKKFLLGAVFDFVTINYNSLIFLLSILNIYPKVSDFVLEDSLRLDKNVECEKCALWFFSDMEDSKIDELFNGLLAERLEKNNSCQSKEIKSWRWFKAWRLEQCLCKYLHTDFKDIDCHRFYRALRLLINSEQTAFEKYISVFELDIGLLGA